MVPVDQTIEVPKFTCELCGMSFNKKFNLNKHTKNMHLNPKRKYIKHIKKDSKYLCSVCGKLYSRSLNLKNHYTKSHTRKELVDSRVPLEPIIRYTKKQVTPMIDNNLLALDYEN